MLKTITTDTHTREQTDDFFEAKNILSVKQIIEQDKGFEAFFQRIKEYYETEYKTEKKRISCAVLA
jgi:hypothetical protein